MQDGGEEGGGVGGAAEEVARAGGEGEVEAGVGVALGDVVGAGEEVGVRGEVFVEGTLVHVAGGLCVRRVRGRWVWLDLLAGDGARVVRAHDLAGEEGGILVWGGLGEGRGGGEGCELREGGDGEGEDAHGGLADEQTRMTALWGVCMGVPEERRKGKEPVIRERQGEQRWVLINCIHALPLAIPQRLAQHKMMQ